MDLIKNNKLFLACDTIKEELKYAYKSRSKIQMLDSINTIIKICKGTGNTRLLWFARLLSNQLQDKDNPCYRDKNNFLTIK